MSIKLTKYHSDFCYNMSSTTFYASSINRNVNIPNNKVCGYKIKNNIMPRGHSSGVRTGKNNGVVNQKLSRFATDYEAKKKYSCPGNTNWYNYSKPTFMKTRSGSAFSLDRKTFRAGSSINGMIMAGKISSNMRAGLGNYDITRNNFTSPDIMARKVLDFDKLQAMDIAMSGTKVQLSDKTIAEFFTVKIPDPLDTKWLNEKARLTAVYTAQGMAPDQIRRELEVNKPLGREQRTIKSKSNIAQSNLTMGQKLDEIKQEVDEGRAESRQQQIVLIGHLANILADTNRIDQLTALQLRGLSQTIARLNLARNHKQMGLEPRFVDITYYNANAGLINLFLFANVAQDPNFGEGPNNINYRTPVRNFAGSVNGLPGMTFPSFISAMGRAAGNRRYMDLHRRGIISRDDMRAAVAAIPGGFDNNAEVSIAIYNR